MANQEGCTLGPLKCFLFFYQFSPKCISFFNFSFHVIIIIMSSDFSWSYIGQTL